MTHSRVSANDRRQCCVTFAQRNDSEVCNDTWIIVLECKQQLNWSRRNNAACTMKSSSFCAAIWFQIQHFHLYFYAQCRNASSLFTSSTVMSSWREIILTRIRLGWKTLNNKSLHEKKFFLLLNKDEKASGVHKTPQSGLCFALNRSLEARVSSSPFISYWWRLPGLWKWSITCWCTVSKVKCIIAQHRRTLTSGWTS